MKDKPFSTDCYVANASKSNYPSPAVPCRALVMICHVTARQKLSMLLLLLLLLLLLFRTPGGKDPGG